jgi:diadenosine tetraphosphate (Ap4A) HIT family hydrolase
VVLFRFGYTLSVPSHRIATEGRIVVVPKEHVPSVHALPMAVQGEVRALLSNVRGRLRTGMVPDGGFSLGFDGAGRTR